MEFQLKFSLALMMNQMRRFQGHGCTLVGLTTCTLELLGTSRLAVKRCPLALGGPGELGRDGLGRAGSSERVGQGWTGQGRVEQGGAELGNAGTSRQGSVQARTATDQEEPEEQLWDPLA